MKADDVKRLKELERENGQLKRLVADKELENLALKELAKGNFEPVAPSPWGPGVAGPSRHLGAAGVPVRPASTASTQRREAVVAEDDAALGRVCASSLGIAPGGVIAGRHAELAGEGWQINRKRVQRVWREEGLRVPRAPQKAPKARGLHGPRGRLRAERPNHVWAFDFQFDQTADGHILKLLHVVDEFTREALEIKCARSIDADATVAVLERLTAFRGRAPEFVRCDNGPEMTANALKDWCRFSGAGASYIDPGQPIAEPLRRVVRQQGP